MATCCEIGFLNADGTVVVSTIRADGYLPGVGSILFKHYADPEKALALCNLGWIYELDAELEDIECDAVDPNDSLGYPVSRGTVVDTYGERPDYLFRDGKWFYGVSNYDGETMRYQDYAPITREWLIADGVGYGFTHLEEYLDSDEREDTAAERRTGIVANGKASSAKSMRENPGSISLHFGDSKTFGVACSSVDATNIDIVSIFADAEMAAQTGRGPESPYPPESNETLLWEAYYSTQV